MICHVDVLGVFAHPDDAELSIGGTVLSLIQKGKTVGLVDLTRGELGTRGNVDTRHAEATEAANILGVRFRGNLTLPDGWIDTSKTQIIKVIEAIRAARPSVLLTNAILDRHPDHGASAQLVRKAVFMSGLAKVNTTYHGKKQAAFRPSMVYYAVQSDYIKPDIVVDISKFWGKKQAAIKAFKSQFYDPDSTENPTFISSLDFMKLVESRAREYGSAIRTTYGEGFTTDRQIGVSDLFDLI